MNIPCPAPCCSSLSSLLNYPLVSWGNFYNLIAKQKRNLAWSTVVLEGTTHHKKLDIKSTTALSWDIPEGQ
jgi:hypothetical protein